MGKNVEHIAGCRVDHRQTMDSVVDQCPNGIVQAVNRHETCSLRNYVKRAEKRREETKQSTRKQH